MIAKTLLTFVSRSMYIVASPQPTLLREPRITAGEVCGAIVGPGCGAWEEINSWTIHIPDKERETAGRKEGPRGEPLRYEEDQG